MKIPVAQAQKEQKKGLQYISKSHPMAKKLEGLTLQEAIATFPKTFGTDPDVLATNLKLTYPDGQIYDRLGLVFLDTLVAVPMGPKAKENLSLDCFFETGEYLGNTYFTLRAPGGGELIVTADGVGEPAKAEMVTN